MSKERALLKRLVSVDLCDIYDLIIEAQELLAQPEQSETEKEHKHMQKWLNLGYAHGIVDAEKAHGIIGGE